MRFTANVFRSFVRIKRVIPVSLLGLLCLGLLPSSATARGMRPAGGGGAVGGYWRLHVSAKGTMNGDSTFTGSSGYFRINSTDVLVGGGHGSAPLSIGQSDYTSDTGGCTTRIDFVGGGYAMPGGSAAGTYNVTTSGAELDIDLEWVPKNGDAVADPAPSTATVYYRSSVTTGGLGPTDPDGYSSVYMTCDGITAFNGSSKTGPFTAVHLTSDPQNPGLHKHLTVSLNYNGTFYQFTPAGPYTGAHYTAGMQVDFCLAGYNLGRFGPGFGRRLSGGNNQGSSDPTYTRWLPLAFSPQMSSQPFRTAAGALDIPWGNVNCLYSPSIYVDANPDLDAGSLLYIPSMSGGNYNNPGPPYQPLSPFGDKVFLTGIALTDVNGDRLCFTSGLGPYADVHSRLTYNGGINGVYTLSQAGPPGAMRQQGLYTYTFANVGVGRGTRLTRIQDELGNHQDLQWSLNGVTVTDSSSGRKLVFNFASGGYVSSVDAPELAGTTPHTHTTLTYDSTGHATDVKVYTGNGQTLLNSDHYVYGSSQSPDSITSRQSGLVTTGFNYTADSTVLDPYGLSTPRLSSKTLGSTTDGAAGTWNYTYGATQQGYNHFGVDARTNTTTDPNGNVFTSIYDLTLTNAVPSGVVTGVKSIGPDFTGASAGSNNVYTQYTPDIGEPSAINVRDQNAQNWLLQCLTDGQPTLFKDPLLHTWGWSYNADNRLVSYTDPTNYGYTLGWGENGAARSRLTSIHLPTTGLSVLYNTFGQPTTFTIPASGSASGSDENSTFAYQATTGDLLTATSPLGDVLGLTGRDALGDLTSVTAYPDTGSPTNSTTPLTVGIVYDAAQHPTTITGPGGTQQVTTYNNDLPTRRQTVRQGTTLAQTDTSYDSRGRTKQVTDTVGLLVGYGYDKNSNLTGLTDGNSNTTQFTYGHNNEPTRLTWPDSTHADLIYNNDGTLYKVTDERGIVSNFLYDTARRLTDVLYPTSTSESIHYTYDNANRLLTAADGNSGRTYTYDATSKRLSSVSTLLAGLPAGHNTFLVSYAYYPDGSVQTVTTPVGVTHYAYLKNGKLQTLSDPFGNTTTYTYDHAGRVTKQSTLTAGGRTIATAYTWGVSGQAGDSSTAPAYLRQITHSINGAALWTYTLQHSYLGQLTTQQGATTQTGRSSSEQWAYDGRGRLSNHAITIQTPTGNLSANGTFDYDLAGNVNAALSGGGGGGGDNSPFLDSVNSLPSSPYVGVASNLTYLPHLRSVSSVPYIGSADNPSYTDSTDSLLSLSSADLFPFTLGVGSAPVESSASEANTSGSGRGKSGVVGGIVGAGWTYNASNQLTAATAIPELAGGSGLAYDASGNLKTCNGLTLTWSNAGNLSGLSGTGVSASYIYDGAGRRVGKTAGGQTGYWLYIGGVPYAELNSSGNVVRVYTWGPLGLISDTAGTATRVSLFDGASNLREMVDGSTGGVLWQGGWQAWGASLSSAPPAAFGYKGQWGAYTDGESGLLLMGARYYAPALGRFVSRDPSGFASGPNLYTFCWDDPVNFFDPNGCEPESISDGFWDGVSILHDIEKTLGGPLGGGLTGSWMGAHDAVTNASSTLHRYEGGKASPWEVAKAFYHADQATGEAAVATIGAAMGAGELLGEAGAAESVCGEAGECFVAGTRVLVARPAQAASRPRSPVQSAALSRSKLTLASLSSSTSHSSVTAKSTLTKSSRISSATRLVLLPIEQLRAGDLAVSRNPRTGKTEYKRVLRPTQSHTSVLVAVALTDKQGHQETITATRQHPFYVSGKGFVPAGGLAIGNSIVTRAGPSLKVKAIQWKRRADGWTVYNAVIADDHTYFVGTLGGGVWVHNPTRDCTRIAYDILNKEGEGSIIRVEPPEGAPYIGERDPSGEPWQYHDVYTNDGMVRDPMRGHPEEMPFEEWWDTWRGKGSLRPRYLTPEDLAKRFGRLRF